MRDEYDGAGITSLMALVSLLSLLRDCFVKIFFKVRTSHFGDDLANVTSVAIWLLIPPPPPVLKISASIVRGVKGPNLLFPL